MSQQTKSDQDITPLPSGRPNNRLHHHSVAKLLFHCSLTDFYINDFDKDSSQD
uniref:Uncharacterized protein n=1 Tax=Arion vulgaris TaxID=1028688 RepID=A0A0B6YTD7_9EUPU